jgi:hypothetical protein
MYTPLSDNNTVRHSTTSVMATSDNESDEDLKRAIALSLQQQDSSPIAVKPARETSIIDLVSSDEDDDLDKPVIGRLDRTLDIRKDEDKHSPSQVTTGKKDTMSRKIRQNMSASTSTAQEPVEVDALDGMEMAMSGSKETILQTMDRKQMEKERLARARKRKPSASPPASLSVAGRNVKARITAASIGKISINS